MASSKNGLWLCVAVSATVNSCASPTGNTPTSSEAFGSINLPFHFDAIAAEVKPTLNLDPAKLVIEAAIREAELVGRTTLF